MGNVIFDLDGTLIDSAPDIRAAGNLVLAEQGVAPMDLDETISFIGKGTPVFIGRMIAARGLDTALQDQMLAAFLVHYADAVHLTTLYPGVTDCLDQLSAHRLGICTNKPVAPAHAVLTHFGLRARFDVVLGGDSLTQRKPDPAPLLACVTALGGGPTVYVGDSEVDAETAERANLPFALFTEGYRHTPVDALPHDATFERFEELPAIVARLMG